MGRGRALAALALIAPVPSIGVLFMLFLWPGAAGKVAAFAGKLWIAVLPLVWVRWVEGGTVRFPLPSAGGWVAGLATGAAVFAVMLGAFALVEPLLSPALVASLRAKAVETGFDRWITFLAMFAYVIAVNSLIEEYVWRWFCTPRCMALMPGSWSPRARRIAAVVLASTLFTVHHAVALTAWVDWRLNLIACVGVFCGGAIWSGLMLRYGSIWPGFASHAVADVAVAIIAYRLIFGPS